MPTEPTANITTAPTARLTTLTPRFLTLGAWTSYETSEELIGPDIPSFDPNAFPISCPHLNNPPTSKPAKLGVVIGDPPNDHVHTFVFDGPKPFISYVTPMGGLPTGTFAVSETLSEDLQYIATGPLTMSCSGRYIRIPGLLIWTGILITRKVANVAASGLQPPEECDESGGGVVSLRAGHQGGVCGSQTASPGSGAGEPPLDGGSPNCEWVRYYVIYTDGSWDWLTGWEHECDGDPELRASIRVGGIASLPSVLNEINVNPPKGPASPLRLRLLGTDHLPSGRAIELHRVPEGGIDAVIRIDTTRGTSADLETAFAVAMHLGNVGGNGHIGGILGSPSQRATLTSGPSSRADGFFRALLQAEERVSQLFGQTRRLDIIITGGAAEMSGELNSKSVVQSRRPTGPIR